MFIENIRGEEIRQGSNAYTLLFFYKHLMPLASD
jgi:hypothetical protein